MTLMVPPFVLWTGTSRKAAEFPLLEPTLRQYRPKPLRASAIGCQPPFFEIEGSSHGMRREPPPDPAFVTVKAERATQNPPPGASRVTSRGPSGAFVAMAMERVACVPAPFTVAGPSLTPSSAWPSCEKTTLL